MINNPKVQFSNNDKQIIKKSSSLLEVENLITYFPVKKKLVNLFKPTEYVKAVNDVSLKINKGETFGLVGESGCGKSTIGRTIMQLIEKTSGRIFFDGQEVSMISKKEYRERQHNMQIVFQDPYSSLNPRQRIGKIIEEPLTIHDIGMRNQHFNLVMETLEKVGLQLDHYYRYPHELSGGQRQRVGIARAIITNPKLLIADEPVSALDVSVQSQIINLLQTLQSELGMAYLFISHDISVVRYISDRIGVMYLGKIVEEADSERLIESPLHPYTQSLLRSVPKTNANTNGERIILKGEIPSPLNPPSGCVFRTRCSFATDICKIEVPKQKEMEKNHFVACHLY